MTLLLSCLLRAHQLTLPYCVREIQGTLLILYFTGRSKQKSHNLHFYCTDVYFCSSICIITAVSYRLCTLYESSYLCYALHNLTISHHTGKCWLQTIISDLYACPRSIPLFKNLSLQYSPKLMMRFSHYFHGSSRRAPLKFSVKYRDRCFASHFTETRLVFRGNSTYCSNIVHNVQCKFHVF